MKFKNNLRFSIKYALHERALRRTALVMLIALLNETLFPLTALALTSGPTQPEVQGFTPVGTSDMVDLFTGDFSYNIPLLDAGGYPINLSYQAGSGIDDEASWVGLGWSLNPGVLNRNMRGIPDDFKGDEIKKEYNIKPDVTTGFSTSVPIQALGIYIKRKKQMKGLTGYAKDKLLTKFKNKRIQGKIAVSLGGVFNSYKGFAFEVGSGMSIGKILSPNVNVNYNSHNGLDISPSIGLSHKTNTHTFALRMGTTFNSMNGLKNMTLSGSVTRRLDYEFKNKDGVIERSSVDGMSVSRGGYYNFGQITYAPTSDMPLKTRSFTFHGTVGFELLGVHPSTQVVGYQVIQELEKKEINQRTYGYINTQSANNDASVVLDFNKERPIAYRESLPKMPLAFGTYDLFSASGQGISGQFRAMRNDVGVFRDAYNSTSSVANNLGIEAGIGAAAHAGMEFKSTETTVSNGDWDSGRGVADKLAFTDYRQSDLTYEPTTLKNSGEGVAEQNTSNSLRTLLKDKEPIALSVSPTKEGGVANSINMRTYSSDSRGAAPVTLSNTAKRDSRVKRNQIMSYLTAQEASEVGLDRQIESHQENAITFKGYQGAGIVTKQPRARFKAHHISEVTISQSDGSRYLYGIPAYNTLQKEVSFAINKPTTVNEGLVDYNADVDNSINNTQGRDNFYSAQTLPPYAHAYLLTAILSPDYVDIGNDGITEDDMGMAVKLNYTRSHTDYQWRAPYTKARYQEGYKTDDRDDKANYTYGKKEVWYVHSIETKTMVAQFYTSDREDGLGVVNENGGKNTAVKLKKLDKIVLYSKSDLLKGNAVPIKTVHFEYDYKLCSGTENSNNGKKLTLKRLWFTYGNNSSGKLNVYKFSYYNEDNSGMVYNQGYYDRWGSYKNPNDNPNQLANDYYPYALQNKAKADENAAAWNLREIELPSGGRIQVEYESDDYAYVQNKRAGQMFMIKGFSRAGDGDAGNFLYADYQANKYLHIDIGENLPNVEEFKKKYLADVEKIYFSTLINIGNNMNKQWEYIKGYMSIDNTNPIVINGTVVKIPIKLEPARGLSLGKPLHPIFKIASQTLRLELPYLVFPEQDWNSNEPFGKKFLSTLLGAVPQVYKTLRGFDRYILDLSRCREVSVNHSWVRLSNPNQSKLGGGSRVKRITVNNYWQGDENNTDPNKANYGQEYSYKNEDGTSSGVAAYEPMIGNDENPFRRQLAYDDKMPLAPNNTYYLEEPIGESLFPSPTVGYARVLVKNIGINGVNTNRRTGTGYSVSEFYTAKDFPVKVEHTYKQNARYRPNLGQQLLNFFKFDSRQMTAASQGYTVEVNDIHGKPKKETIYSATGNSPISWTKYDYKIDAENRLSNDNIPMVTPEGDINKGTIGFDMDVWHYMQQENVEVKGDGASMNIDLTNMGTPFPIPCPVILPLINREITQYRGAVTTKLIKRTGILDKVTKMEDGSTVTTENALWDSETGQVLMTKTQNEYKDNIYQLTIPAHWAYEEGMGMAYKNIGIIVNGLTIGANGEIPASHSTYFVAGDDLLVNPDAAAGIIQKRANVIVNSAGRKSIIDISGAPLQGVFDIKILRSGRRNLQTTPVGSIVTMQDPREGNRLNIASLQKVITAQAATFRDDWTAKVGMREVCTPDTDVNKDLIKKLLEDIATAKINGVNLTNTNVGAISSIGRLYPTPMPPNSGIALRELTPNHTANISDGTDYGVLPAWSSYKIQIGEKCILTIVPQSGYFSFGNSIGQLGVSYNTAENRWILTGKFSTELTAYAYLECQTCTKQCFDVPLNAAINPYRLGMKGNWRPYETYAIYTGRTASINTPNKILKTQGMLSDFSNFWQFSGNGVVKTPNSKWINTNTVTQYDAKSNEVENKDALGIYSSALYRYNNTLASAVAANARLREIGFDGFEDYNFLTETDKCYPEHWNFAKDYLGNLSTKKAHTGRFSLSVPHNANLVKNVTLGAINDNVQGLAIDGNMMMRRFPNVGFTAETKVIVSAWVSKEGDCTPTSFEGVALNINMGNDGSVTLHPTGPVIEGWQRIEGVVTIPTGATSFEVSIANNLSEEKNLFIDDIRFLPFNAKMKSFVYDARTMRLMAQLDENNYATFYEYDDEGSLIRTKRETEKGVVTVQENRNFIRPNNQ